MQALVQLTDPQGKWYTLLSKFSTELSTLDTLFGPLTSTLAYLHTHVGAYSPVNKNSTLRQRLRRHQRSRLELSAGRTPSFIADGCSVCQAFENSLIFVTELPLLRIFISRYTNVLIIYGRPE